MKTTHQMKPRELTAWQFKRGTPVPVWVARRAHDLGDGKLSMETAEGIAVADEGDWIVCSPGEPEVVYPIARVEFEDLFEPIGFKCARISDSGEALPAPAAPTGYEFERAAAPVEVVQGKWLHVFWFRPIASTPVE